ncbi:MAG: hypothetical protein ACYDB7_11285 [Mycobacteriales bacterium]
MLLAVAACNSSTHHDSSPSASSDGPSSIVPSSSASATTDPAAVVAATLVSAYAATYGDVEAAVRQGDAQSRVLARHAIPPAEYELQGDVEQYLKLGITPVGVPDLHARVLSVNLTLVPEEAVLVSCPGAQRLVYRSSGKPVTVRRLPSNPFTVSLQMVNGRWVVSYFQANRSKTCTP